MQEILNQQISLACPIVYLLYWVRFPHGMRNFLCVAEVSPIDIEASREGADFL
jgi:hypothetical protein